CPLYPGDSLRLLRQHLPSESLSIRSHSFLLSGYMPTLTTAVLISAVFKRYSAARVASASSLKHMCKPCSKLKVTASASIYHSLNQSPGTISGAPSMPETYLTAHPLSGGSPWIGTRKVGILRLNTSTFFIALIGV